MLRCFKTFIWRNCNWEVYDSRKSDIPRNGELIRVRGERELYVICKATKRTDGTVKTVSHLIGMLSK